MTAKTDEHDDIICEYTKEIFGNSLIDFNQKPKCSDIFNYVQYYDCTMQFTKQISEDILSKELEFFCEISSHKCRLNNKISTSSYMFVMYALRGLLELYICKEFNSNDMYRVMFKTFGAMLDNIVDPIPIVQEEIEELSRNFALVIADDPQMISNIKCVMTNHNFNTKRHLVMYLTIAECRIDLRKEFIKLGCIGINYLSACTNIIQRIAKEGHPNTLNQINNVNNLKFLCEYMLNSKYYDQSLVTSELNDYKNLVLHVVLSYDAKDKQKIYDTVNAVIKNNHIDSTHLNNIFKPT
jgi:hypothetical protein